MVNTLYLPELREMLADDDRAGLAEFCTALHAARTAEFMEGLTAEESWQVLQHTDPRNRIEIFSYLDQAKQVEILETAPPEETSALIAEMPADDRVDLLNQVSPEAVDLVMPLMPAEERRDIMRLSAYPEGTAGSLMTTDIAMLPESLTVRAALEEIARQAGEHETIYYIYTVDDERHLRGLVSARQLVTHLNKPNMPLADLVERDLVTVVDTDDQETVAAKVADYDFLAIPVVDAERRLLGIITHDDIIDVLREEAEEDAYLAGGLEPLAETYLDTPWYELAWKRGLWLTILFVAATLTATTLKTYDEELKAVPWLVFFIPLVTSCGGNSGTQSTTLAIRALTNKDITPRDWWRVLRREVATGLCLGGFLAIIGFGIARVVAREPALSEIMVVPLTLIGVVTCGSVIGSQLPLLFRRLGLDEALMSSPFLAGIIDIIGIVIYMTVAIALLQEFSI
ncbi:MAG: magnesium transporter [Pirellulales bacterium]|nr:magnesium transporter [Pirellulales bacterium]MBX3435198.1 magnesium transporter [Pirellulales bacterium]